MGMHPRVAGRESDEWLPFDSNKRIKRFVAFHVEDGDVLNKMGASVSQTVAP